MLDADIYEIHLKHWGWAQSIAEKMGDPTKEILGVVISNENGFFDYAKKIGRVKFWTWEYGKTVRRYLAHVIYSRTMFIVDEQESFKVEFVTDPPEGCNERTITCSNINEYMKKKYPSYGESNER